MLGMMAIAVIEIATAALQLVPATAGSIALLAASAERAVVPRVLPPSRDLLSLQLRGSHAAACVHPARVVHTRVARARASRAACVALFPSPVACAPRARAVCAPIQAAFARALALRPARVHVPCAHVPVLPRAADAPPPSIASPLELVPPAFFSPTAPAALFRASLARATASLALSHASLLVVPANKHHANDKTRIIGNEGKSAIVIVG